MKNYKTVLIALTLSLNAQADIFGDVGDWVKNNKTVTAVIGVGALTAGAIAIKPISGLLRAGEGEAGLVDVIAGAEGAGAEAESLEAAASESEWEMVDSTTGGEPKLRSFDEYINEDMMKEESSESIKESQDFINRGLERYREAGLNLDESGVYGKVIDSTKESEL
jgi:hypothetical protein